MQEKNPEKKQPGEEMPEAGKEGGQGDVGKKGGDWGDKGEQEIFLEQWDTISVPPGVMRGFRNAGTEDAYLLAMLGGTDAGRVVWSPDVLEKAKQTGLSLDKKGNLVSVRT